MTRLVADRYCTFDDLHGCDLATGERVRLDALPSEPVGGGPASLIEVLNDARDGAPRWIVADAGNAAQAAAISVRAAADARRRGFVPLLVPLYLRWKEALAVDLDERTLLLIGSFGRGLAAARGALVQAASCSPRPHVLLTFTDRKGPRRTSASIGAACVVREARAAYGAMRAMPRPRSAELPPDVLRLVERASRAHDFQRLGRHAAAERLLRDVAGGLARRQARAPAAATLMTLGRMLLERGRVGSAERAFDEAAQIAQAADEEPIVGEARIWQAAARTDGGRLTDAESICRAVLLTRQLSPGRQAWANAMLVRILLWQGRVDEAQSCVPAVPDGTADLDATTAATIEAMGVRVLLAGGEIFQAGQRARRLLGTGGADKGPDADPLPRIVALTAHVRVLAAAGDLELAEGSLQTLVTLARAGRMPLRALRAQLIWHDALRRAGRDREARSERDRLARLLRAAPALLRRAIEERLSARDDGLRPSQAVPSHTSHVASSAATLVHLVHNEDSDRRALERIAGRLARDLQTTRIDLVSCDAGPVTAVVSRGAGLPTQLGRRALESGLALCEPVDEGGQEIAMPLRMGHRFVAALVCRWPLDRQPPAHARELLELAAAVAAPRADALLTSLREVSRASTSVPELLGVSAAMQEVRRAIERAAKAPFAVLIEGARGHEH